MCQHDQYGWSPVPLNPATLFKSHPTANDPSHQPPAQSFNDYPFPTSELVQKTRSFVKEKLNEPTFNHSNRVFVYGVAIVKTYFPEWVFDEETYYLSCLLHDIGTADAYLSTTKMSFDFKGAFVGREFLLQNGAPEEQADAVAEAIIRHQELFVANGGNITMNGQVLQLSTCFDNVGLRSHLLHEQLCKTTTDAFPRHKWSQVFSATLMKEETLKPWCHTTTFEVPCQEIGRRRFCGHCADCTNEKEAQPGDSKSIWSKFSHDVTINHATGTNFE